MKIVLSNYHYRRENSGGGCLHIEAFISQALASGHLLYAKPCCDHPGVHPLSPHLAGHWWHLRDADLHYVRLQDSYPRKKTSRWFIPPLRRLAPRPLLVWEFNTVPEQGACIGLPPDVIEREKADFRHAAPHCDLAVCVSEAIAGYVRAELGVKHTLVIPNGGQLRPPPPPVTGPWFNVMWAGSAHIDWHEFNLLAASARQLHEHPAGQNIRFHLYGHGTEKLTGLTPNVLVHGPVSHQTITTDSSRMHVGLCLYQQGPADYSSPLKFYDCLGAGLPVVTTPHPQMDAVQQTMDANRLIVGDRQPSTLSRILFDLAADEPRRRRHAERSRQMIAETYNWPALMTKLFTCLEEFVRERRH